MRIGIGDEPRSDQERHRSGGSAAPSVPNCRPHALITVFLAAALLSGFPASARGRRSPNMVPGLWTWENGPNQVAEQPIYGIYGTRGVAAATNMPGARYGSVTWRDGSGNLWLFGGAALRRAIPTS